MTRVRKAYAECPSGHCDTVNFDYVIECELACVKDLEEYVAGLDKDADGVEFVSNKYPPKSMWSETSASSESTTDETNVEGEEPLKRAITEDKAPVNSKVGFMDNMDCWDCKEVTAGA